MSGQASAPPSNTTHQAYPPRGKGPTREDQIRQEQQQLTEERARGGRASAPPLWEWTAKKVLPEKLTNVAGRFARTLGLRSTRPSSRPAPGLSRASRAVSGTTSGQHPDQEGPPRLAPSAVKRNPTLQQPAATPDEGGRRRSSSNSSSGNSSDHRALVHGKPTIGQTLL